MLTVTESLMVSTVVATMVPKMDTTALPGTMVPGASLCDRATLSSPLHGLAPSGGYPSRLRSLRSLRAVHWCPHRCGHFRRVPRRRFPLRSCRSSRALLPLERFKPYT